MSLRQISEKTRHPYRLMTPNIASRIHSQFGNLEVIRSVVEEPAWEISVCRRTEKGPPERRQNQDIQLGER
jgi:hypothetical protein